jgi:CDP-4-dehydro-6-deoxyglucose reductase, E3
LPGEWKIVFKPGQWISVRLPIGERGLVRAYSLAEPEVSCGSLVLVLDRVPGGIGSGYLFSLVEGDELLISGPYGSFLAPEPLTQDLIFIARFTGIVPIRCILKKLFAEPVSRKVTLIYGSPSVEKQLYHEEFLAMSQSHSTFQYLPAVSTQAERTAKGLELEILEALWKGSKDFLPMLSGVKAFVRPIKTYLSEVGFTRKEIKVEAYD